MPRVLRIAPLLLAGVAAAAAPGCAKRDRTSIVAAVHPHRASVPIGGPLDVTLTFHVPRDAPPVPDDCRVLLRFLFDDGTVMGSYDHEPPIPPRQWLAGRTVSYTRRIFAPDVPYVGDATIVAGLYSTSGKRLRLAGRETGDRTYPLARVSLNARRILLVHQGGWHPYESPPNEPGWRWIGSAATMTFHNPQRDAVLHLRVDAAPGRVETPQRVSLRIGDRVVHSFDVGPEGTIDREFPLSAGDLGGRREETLTIQVEKIAPNAGNGDGRELGIRVHNVFLEPRSAP